MFINLPIVNFLFHCQLLASSEQMSTNPWRNKNPLEPQEPPTLTLTSATSSNKLSLRVYEVLLTRYFFTSNAAFFMVLLLTFTPALVTAFVCLFQDTSEISWVIFSTRVSLLVALHPWLTKRQAKTNKQLNSKNWTFLFDMLTDLSLLDFEQFSFWQTTFEKQAKPTDLPLSSSTRIGIFSSIFKLKH